jgi:hypothetical protein
MFLSLSPSTLRNVAGGGGAGGGATGANGRNGCASAEPYEAGIRSLDDEPYEASDDDAIGGAAGIHGSDVVVVVVGAGVDADASDDE